ncbi:MAG: PAS domain-containing protein [Candidatus Limnocylindrales bacterium]
MRARISTIPSSDPAFGRAVEKVAAQTPDASAADLEAGLRPLFPRVAIFARHVSGEHGHLYVYRDGHYDGRPREQWWDEPRTACVCVDAASGDLTQVSAEWAQLMAGDPGALVGRNFTDFVLPEARAAASGLFEAVQEGGVVDTEVLLVREDGSPIALEVHARRLNGEIDVRYRRLD